ncbi:MULTISPECIES: SGNH/GDSL hydrolase family protein [unclassified Nocardiopsis]|uniref:SGNH/GDSL hydrolase family protein n=1 Tax=unclassified Nocardiopsis TaxID=2649073 RepID=UPI00135BC794|nr:MULTISPECIES: SGNH/GDSL hydrolase family protein [unclassified Nocardiopsis]
MRNRFLRAAAHVVAGLALTAAAVAAPQLPARADAGGELAAEDTVRIMPLGDSITGSPGCWRALLWADLSEAGRTDADFVGTRPGDGCGFEYDGDNEGHGGFLVTDVARRGLLVDWLDRTDPDVVMMHFGTNDVWSAVPTGQVLEAYGTLVSQMRAHNPRMRILVAQIIPMDPDRSCAECGERVRDLNAAIPGWAAGLSTRRSPVTVVDQWTGFDTDTDTYDGVHPSASGDRRIADRWREALLPLLC